MYSFKLADTNLANIYSGSWVGETETENSY